MKQDYLPFGEDVFAPDTVNPLAERGTVVRYTGQVKDVGTGLYYYNARWYDPEIGRFTREDEYRGDIGRPQSFNLFIYTANNPLKFVDPSGNIYLQPGAKGEDVELAQKYLGIPQTGIFDESMLEAVNAFKDKYDIGNTGVWQGAIGDYTLDAMARSYYGLPILTAEEFAELNDIYVNDRDDRYFNWGKTSDKVIGRGVGISKIIDKSDVKNGVNITSEWELNYYLVNVSPATELFGMGLYGNLFRTIDFSRYSRTDIEMFLHCYYAGLAFREQIVLMEILARSYSVEVYQDEGIPKSGTLSNIDARKWYLEQESKIPRLIDKTLPLEQQAKQAVNLRNQFRTQARNLMADRKLAASLNKTDPNLTWEQVVQKYSNKGFQGDALYWEIINAAQRSRTSVNQSLGIQ